MDFLGNVAIITGASGDIGAGTALMFAEMGVHVVINYLSNREKAEAVASKIENMGKHCMVIQADASNVSEVDSMVSETVNRFGRIDILVNNAGVRRKPGDHKYILDVTEEEWDMEISSHLKSTFICSKKVLPFMIKQKYGRIINISSVAARSGSVGASVQYPAAKEGIAGFTKALANQVAKDGITVNVVAPGMIDSERIRWRTPEMMEEHIKKIPVGRLGKIEEVAGTIVFLSSKNAAYITGATIDVNGGMYMC